MTPNIHRTILIVLMAASFASATERPIVTLRDFSDSELKMAGIELPRKVTVRIKALGAGGDYGWTYRSDRMFAYGWIIDANSRNVVWEMTTRNTSAVRDDRECDGEVTLERGSYEVYFAACTFAYHTTFTHLNMNIDHRESEPFGSGHQRKKDFISYLKGWWVGDAAEEWGKRAGRWGIDILLDEDQTGSVKTFSPPKDLPNVAYKAVGLGENDVVQRSFSVAEPTRVRIYALGEGKGERDAGDYGWIVNAQTRARVWELRDRNAVPAGGAEKNIRSDSELLLDKGTYALYFITDDSHSAADWNAAPPYDPLNWGITIATTREADRKNLKFFPYEEDKNVIVRIIKVGDDENRTDGFTLKEDSKIRVYAFGERSNSRRQLADYGFITDVKTRNKVWTMDVDRSYYAGGASKNCFVDEIVPLSRGSYIVTYRTDDSHAYGDWNDDPPFDPENYGITIMGAGERFDPSTVAKYTEQRDKNVIAQLVRVGNNSRKEERFTLPRTTRVRIYAIGEGKDREMYDYGWIEDLRTHSVVWEMTYSMTFHAGGGRKNRMVNTTILLDKGDYKLHYNSDDSHSYSRWNVDPPDDTENWGITLYKDDGGSIPGIPAPPEPPE